MNILDELDRLETNAKAAEFPMVYIETSDLVKILAKCREMKAALQLFLDSHPCHDCYVDGIMQAAQRALGKE